MADKDKRATHIVDWMIDGRDKFLEDILKSLKNDSHSDARIILSSMSIRGKALEQLRQCDKCDMCYNLDPECDIYPRWWFTLISSQSVTLSNCFRLFLPDNSNNTRQ